MKSDLKNENNIFVAGYSRFAQNHVSLKKFLDVAELRLEKVTVRHLEIKFFRNREIQMKMMLQQESSLDPDQKRSASDFFGIRVSWNRARVILMRRMHDNDDDNDNEASGRL